MGEATSSRKTKILIFDTGLDGQDTIPPMAPKGKKTEHRKRGRKRGPKRKNWMPNPFGKYPASSAVLKYIKETEQYYAPSTQKERTRKTKYICRIMTETLNCPKSPGQVREDDIRNFLAWMNQKNLNHATQRTLLRYLKDYLAYYGNDVVQRMLSRRQIRMPTDNNPEIRSISKDTVDRIHEMTKCMNRWRGHIARFITMAYPYTGLRPSELRTLKYRDLDVNTWTLRVSHPKGENAYGKHRLVGILPQARQAFKDFMIERKAFLEEHGETEDFEALIPHKGWKGLTYWDAQQFNNLKQEIEKVSGIHFRLKDYRATFCQLAIDLGAELQAVSKIMGHKTSMTTETYYGRIRDDTAIREIERAFSEPGALRQITPELKNSQI
jgi:integrase